MKNVLKKLVKSATQVLKKCSVKKLVDGVNHIGNSNLLLKRELIKGFDSSFNKLVNTMETVKFDTNRLVPKYIDNDYEVVTSVEVREKTTKLSSDSKIVYMSTTYYMYLQKHIVNLKLHVKTPVDTIIIDSDNEVVGVVLPIRIMGKELLKGDCIIPNLNITIDRRLQSLDIHDVKSLSIENRNILKDLGFKYYASQKVYYRSYKKDVIEKLNLEITNASFEDEKTLEQLKVELDKKEELKRQQKEDKINDLSVEENTNIEEVKNMNALNKDLKGLSKEELYSTLDELRKINDTQTNKSVQDADLLIKVMNRVNEVYDMIKRIDTKKENMEVEDMEKIIIKNDISDLLDTTIVTEGKTFEIKVYDNFVRCFMLDDENKRVQLYNKDVKIDININTFKELVESNNIEYLNNINVEENKRYFKSTDPGHKTFIVIEGNKSTKKHLTGSTIWKVDTQKHIIKDYGHKDINAYVKHLKKFNYVEVSEDIKENMEDTKMKNITINFGNIVSELEKGNLNIVFLKNRGIFLEDDKNNLYTMGLEKQGSYLDNLIKNSEKVSFSLVSKTISENIGEWEKERWDVSKVKDFIKRQSKYCIQTIESNEITISSDKNEDLNMNLQLLANKDLVNTINESFINNSDNVRNNIIEINSINDIKNIDIKDQFSYMVFWTYTDTNERCKQGYKGKYINKILNEFLECEFIDNIKICSHDYFLNNFNTIKNTTDLLTKY